MGDEIMKKQLLAAIMASAMLVPATAHADELVKQKSNVQKEEKVEKVGWLQEGDNWYYYDHHGDRVVDWLFVDNKWYYLGNDGAMQTGWLQYGGTWYYLNESGVMQTGWVKYDTDPVDAGDDWFYMNQDGAMQTGWLYDGGNWYYLHPSGKMEKYWLELNGKSYAFNDGVMQTGHFEYNRHFYLFGKDGAKITTTGWTEYEGTWYYLHENGVLHLGELRYNGNKYMLTPEMSTGWVVYDDSLNIWSYYDADGKAKNGWLQYGGAWYYLVDGITHIGWLQQGDKWYYLKSGGEMVTGEYFIDGNWYTFRDNGEVIGG